MENSILQRRNILLSQFTELGFIGEIAFYNVCKNIDVTLSSYELASFYKGYKVRECMLSRLEQIIDFLKHE